MSEDFLHHIWKYRLFEQNGMFTTEGEPVEIINPGLHNTHSGPDFFNARIRIGGTEWAGNVEVHINAGDWQKHGHEDDKAYDNIILHVVYKQDIPLYRSGGQLIPTMEIWHLTDPRLYEKYLEFNASNDWIPCQRQFAELPPIVVDGALDRMLTERLERKSETIRRSLSLNHNNWEESFYQLLARNFGFHTNAVPFELLARSLPSLFLARHRSSLLQVEAMLFGQAGMLEAHLSDQYPRALQNEYVYLKKKFGLQPIDAHLWKTLRMRPVNFPCVRIAQFAVLVSRNSSLFSAVLACADVAALQQLFDITATGYWESHYSFDRESPPQPKHFGTASFVNILINTIVPVLFVYGRHKGDEDISARALSLLEALPAESNAVVSGWKGIGADCPSAYHSQAYLQLKNEHCEKRDCLNCNIGAYLLKNS